MTEQDGASEKGALSGIRVLDFSHALAGPFATMILSDLGADVLKVEHPGGGDRTRRYLDKPPEEFSAYFASVNRNKQSVVIDLKKPEGQALARRLAEQADVLVENMSPGVIERLGLGYDELRAINPRLIYASVTGYGQDGPWAERNGVDAMVQALSGTMSITGEPDGAPVRVGFSIADLAAGMFLAIGVLAAVNERHETGLGQSLDVSLLEAMMSLTENAIARHFYTGMVPSREGSAHPYNKLTRAYETSDGWMVAALSARNWKAAVPVLGRPEWLEDPDLQSRPEENADRLVPEVRAILREKTMAYWIEQLGAAGVLCMPINSVAEAVQLPPIVERRFIQESVNSEGRRVRVAGSPIRLSRTPGRVRLAAPLLGEHTESALRSWLGMKEAEYSELEAAGVFQTVERETRGFW